MSAARFWLYTFLIMGLYAFANLAGPPLLHHWGLL